MQTLRRLWLESPRQRAWMIFFAARVLITLAAIALVLLASNGLLGSRTGPTTTIVVVGCSTSSIMSLTPTPMTPAPTATIGPAAGPPTLGAPLANFIVAYGPAFASSQDGCPNFYANKAHTVIVSVTLANGQASAISVLGPKFWNTSRTMASCLAYLPGDAVAVKGALSLPTYHSNIGEVVIFNDGPGSCTISLAS